MIASVTRDVVRVPQRFCGPPQSGNGGYTCGILAKTFTDAAAVECTIRKPIPIERDLRIEVEQNSARLIDDDNVVIEAVVCDVELQLPQPISWEEAGQAVSKSPAFENHPFPTCFVCGPDRDDHDGLRLFPGADQEQSGFENLFAARWVPAEEFAESGIVQPEFVWAAMDCPTGFAAGFPWAGKLVTGRLAVKLVAPLAAESNCIVQSWSLGTEGRKCHAGAVLRGESGDVYAIAKATWIKI